MWELLWLLLPIAAVSGWLIGRRSGVGNERTSPNRYRPAYLIGLSHLINEESDKAIETLVKLLEVDSETVEIHMALGKLYRQRGEVERAIRIHQNLIARPTLGRQQRSDALFALARDYLHAGLFDRAEALFKQLAEERSHSQKALEELLLIYQQEKEWSRGIEVAQRLHRTTGKTRNRMVAHFHCELADEAIIQREFGTAKRQAKLALSVDSDCVRATILLGDLACTQGDSKRALKYYHQIEQQDSEFLPLVLPSIGRCMEKSGNQRGWLDYLRSMREKYNHPTLQSSYAKLQLEQEGSQAAEQSLLDDLEKRPHISTVAGLVELAKNHEVARDSRLLSVVGDALNKLAAQRPSFQCRRCGFVGKTLHWQCPSCKEWSTIKPFIEPSE
jgi:lipopolysaccharide biosynthesis regulator YciM